jgi:hypothetical protein
VQPAHDQDDGTRQLVVQPAVEGRPLRAVPGIAATTLRCQFAANGVPRVQLAETARRELAKSRQSSAARSPEIVSPATVGAGMVNRRVGGAGGRSLGRLDCDLAAQAGDEQLDDLAVRCDQFRRLGGVPPCQPSSSCRTVFWSLSAATRSAERFLRRGPRGLPDRALLERPAPWQLAVADLVISFHLGHDAPSSPGMPMLAAAVVATEGAPYITDECYLIN